MSNRQTAFEEMVEEVRCLLAELGDAEAEVAADMIDEVKALVASLDEERKSLSKEIAAHVRDSNKISEEVVAFANEAAARKVELKKLQFELHKFTATLCTGALVAVATIISVLKPQQANETTAPGSLGPYCRQKHFLRGLRKCFILRIGYR